MLRRQERFHRQVLQVLDALLLCAALFFAHIFRYSFLPNLSWFDISPVGPFKNYLGLMGIILPLGPLLLQGQGIYRTTVSRQPWSIFIGATQAIGLLWFLLLAVIIFLRIPQTEMSRAVLLLFVPLSVAFVLLRDFAYRWFLVHSKSAHQSRHYVMICGERKDHDSWKKMLPKAPRQDLEIKCCIDLRIDTLNEFIRQIHRENIDVVVFEFDHSMIKEQNEAILACEAEGVEAWVTADFVRTVLARPKFDELLGRGLLVYRSTPDASWQLLAKAMIDAGGALILLVLLSPLLLLVALSIWVTSGRPVLFSQLRSGRYGRPFTMFKFRTMATNAEQRKQELQVFNYMAGPVFKMDNDPRVTPLGLWLRRTSLDELPQLWNILRGEMSLVGPRPLPLYETESFVNFSQRRRMSVKPGLTCLWQVAGRNEIRDFTDWVRLDLEYIDQWSLWLDLKILLKTLPVVLMGRGAK